MPENKIKFCKVIPVSIQVRSQSNAYKSEFVIHGQAGDKAIYYNKLFEQLFDRPSRNYAIGDAVTGASILLKNEISAGCIPDYRIIDESEELKTKMLNAVLFANDEVIKSMAEFSKNPTHETYIKSALAIRRDLWGTKTNIDEKALEIFGKIEI